MSEPAASVAPVRSAGTVCIRQTIVHVAVVVSLTYSPRGYVLALAGAPRPFRIRTQQNYYSEMVKVTELGLVLMAKSNHLFTGFFSHTLLKWAH